MSYEDDTWDLQGDAEAALIEEGIRNQRDDQIAGYLGTYGDAVQERIDRCLSEAQQLVHRGFHAPAVVCAVTAAELAIRYFILRPILEGAFLSEEWARILVGRILTQRAASDRELLPTVLRAWEIDINSLRLPDGKQFWPQFVSGVLPLRNDIVHKGANASQEQALEAIGFAEAFLAQVVVPLSDRFGLSWSQTRRWNHIQQGVGGARFSCDFESKSPFDEERTA